MILDTVNRFLVFDDLRHATLSAILLTKYLLLTLVLSNTNYCAF
jgi:hypothetical protein